ncbi:hypothetical protein [Bradyrhizobium cenepequi]
MKTIFALMMCWQSAPGCILYPSNREPMLYATAEACEARIEPLGRMMQGNWITQKAGPPKITCVQKQVSTWGPVE